MSRSGIVEQCTVPERSNALWALVQSIEIDQDAIERAQEMEWEEAREELAKFQKDQQETANSLQGVLVSLQLYQEP
jgi:hypothetical protein